MMSSSRSFLNEGPLTQGIWFGARFRFGAPDRALVIVKMVAGQTNTLDPLDGSARSFVNIEASEERHPGAGRMMNPTIKYNRP